MILDAENMIFSAGNSFYCMIQQIDMGHLQIGIFQTGIIYSIRMILGRDFYFPGFKFLPDGFLPGVRISTYKSPRHRQARSSDVQGIFQIMESFLLFSVPVPEPALHPSDCPVH